MKMTYARIKSGILTRVLKQRFAVIAPIEIAAIKLKLFICEIVCLPNKRDPSKSIIMH